MVIINKNFRLLILFVPLLISINFVPVKNLIAQTPDTLWTENWEGNWTKDWHVDAGTWEVGAPTSGPGSAFSNDKCSGTVLNGNYSENVDSRLIRHTNFTVPPANENPRLRFWHWFNINTDDKGYVEIKYGASSWIRISPEYDHTSSNKWSYTSIDLSGFAGKTVEIAFHFTSKAITFYSGTYTHVSSGWYIDDISVIKGPLNLNNPENWENGLGDWSVERGTWEIGKPTYGPDNTPSGINCAATVLDGKYDEWVDSRLVSPKFIVPDSSQSPRLRFWQYYSFSADDKGYVEVRVENEDWEKISLDYTNTSLEWTYPSLDLTPYSNKNIQLAFHFISQAKTFYSGTYTHTSSGWYIDDVAIVTGPITFVNPEEWENGMGDWSAERGTWQIGKPTTGPGKAYSGENCAATVLDDNYEEWVDSRLVSPKFEVPSTDQNPSLRFWHWFSFSADDKGFVEIKINDNDWQQISSDYVNTSSNVWTNTYFDLSSYAGSTAQIAFRFISKANTFYSGTYTHVSSGWYIDNVEINGLSTDLSDWKFNDLPLEFNLYQNYPNPFNPTTTIKYALPKESKVKLEVFNVLGQKVAVLVNARKAAGYHQVTFNGSGLPSGVYYYRMETDKGFIQTKKLVLLK